MSGTMLPCRVCDILPALQGLHASQLIRDNTCTVEFRSLLLLLVQHGTAMCSLCCGPREQHAPQSLQVGRTGTRQQWQGPRCCSAAWAA